MRSKFATATGRVRRGATLLAAGLLTLGCVEGGDSSADPPRETANEPSTDAAPQQAANGRSFREASTGDEAGPGPVVSQATDRLYRDGLTSYGYGDYPRARKLFESACEAGSAAGCEDAGMMLSLGRGGPQDKDQAHELFESACKGGSSMGCQYLTTPPERNDNDEP